MLYFFTSVLYNKLKTNSGGKAMAKYKREVSDYKLFGILINLSNHFNLTFPEPHKLRKEISDLICEWEIMLGL